MKIAPLILAISAFVGVQSTPLAAQANPSCAIPTLLEPTDSQVIVYEGRSLHTKISSKDCDSLAIKITNIETGEITFREFNREGYNPVFYTVSDFTPQIGKYLISIQATDSTRTRSPSDPTPDRRFKYVPRQCTLPSFTPDLAGRVIRQDPAGFSLDVTSTDCGVLQLEIGPEATWPASREVYFGQVGYDGGTVTLSNRASPQLEYGTYLATLQTGDTDPNQNQEPSEVVGPVRFRIAKPVCPDPIIVTPTPNQHFTIAAGQDKYPVFFEVRSSEDRCRRITYSIIGSSAPTFSGRTVDRPYVGTVPSPAGSYVLTVTADDPDDEGSASHAVTRSYYVDPPAPEPTHKIHRRKLQCKSNQTVCPHTDIRGRTFMMCVSDLDSNLERCGGCDGPDCTTLPNVDEVACIAGKCQISSCLTGYFLLNNACTAKKQPVLQIQARKRSI